MQVRGFGFFVVDDATYVTGKPEVMQGINLQNLAWSFHVFDDPNWVPSPGCR
jgi:hypothetical protein